MNDIKRTEQIRRLERQIVRYQIKSNPREVAKRLRQSREEMVRNYAEYAQIAQRISQAVCGVTDAIGVSGYMRFWYQNFARQVEKSWRTRRDYLTDDLKVLRYKWQVRGLDPFILELVENAVLNELEKIEKGE
ncbi:MAG: hypothetical protein ABIK42_00690 [candidate division WOR-3 bacterium]